MRLYPPFSAACLSYLFVFLVAATFPGTVARAQDPVQSCPASTPEQMRALTARILNNQHQDDLLLEQYERVERDLVRASGKGLNNDNKDVLSHIVPTGTGTARVDLERDGKPTDAALREQQWLKVAQALQANSRTDDPEVKKEYEKAAKRMHERAEQVDAVGKAFRFDCVGRETRQGHTLLVISFEPMPGFHSSVRFAGLYEHIHGKAWVDEANAQVVRLEGEVFDDYNFIGGLVAKVYRGSRATLEQSEVEPGVWLPTSATFDLKGRLFLFPATFKEQAEASDYRRVGLPQEALVSIRREHPQPAANK